MSDLIDGSPLPDENGELEQEEHSTWAMFLSILLLIAGFLLASALLIQQTLSANNADGEPIFQLSQLIEKGKEMGSRPAAEPVASATTTNEANTSALASIKQMVNLPTGETVRWPKLKLTGFGTSTDGAEGFAIINGDLIHPGETTRKVTLVEIRSHDVIVEYKGERKTLTVGMED